MKSKKKAGKCEPCTASRPIEPASAAVVKRRAQVLKALGHPSRIRILEILSKGETCVCHIAPALDSDLSTVSRHLAVLRNAGIIDDDKRGLNVYYRITMPCVLDFLRCIDKEKA
jgi:DNA-binding transcriptional ArsR family regulator